MSVLLIITSLSIFLPGPRESGCAVRSYAWSDDPVTCITAPAGLVRLTESQFAVYSTASDREYGDIYAAGATRFGDYSFGAGLGWYRSGSVADTLDAVISAARTIRGDPIGFMDGVFGPSISIGGSLGFTSVDAEETLGLLTASIGFQFSVFPTIAIGANAANIRLAGDRLREREIGYGFTTVFHRGFRGHFSITNGDPAFGFDMDVNDWLSVRTGSDGSSWNSGLSVNAGWFGLDWAVLLGNSDYRQILGLSIYPGEF